MTDAFRLLFDHLGWVKSGERQTYFIDGRCQVTLEGERDGVELLLCEARVGVECPNYGERRALRMSLSRATAAPVIVFTDCAHSSFVWSWIARTAGGIARYVEYRVPEQELSLIEALREAPDGQGSETGGEGPTEPPGGLAATEQKVVAAVLGALPSPYASAPTTICGLVQWIQRLDDDHVLRGLWRSASQVTVLDPEAGDVDWLLTVAGMLEAVYLALLDRLRSRVDDESRARARRRPEYLRDIRARVEASEDRQHHPSPVVYVRRLLVQRNLFGLQRSPARLRSCRRRLLHYVRRSEGPLMHLDTNVRLCPNGELRSPPTNWVGHGLCRRGMARNGEPRTDRQPPEAVEILRSAWLAVQAVRLDGSEPFEELATAARELERRRRRLARSILRSEPLRRSSPPAWLELAIEFPNTAGGGGFHVVRGV